MRGASGRSSELSSRAHLLEITARASETARHEPAESLADPRPYEEFARHGTRRARHVDERALLALVEREGVAQPALVPEVRRDLHLDADAGLTTARAIEVARRREHAPQAGDLVVGLAAAIVVDEQIDQLTPGLDAARDVFAGGDKAAQDAFGRARFACEPQRLRTRDFEREAVEPYFLGMRDAFAHLALQKRREVLRSLFAFAIELPARQPEVGGDGVVRLASQIAAHEDLILPLAPLVAFERAVVLGAQPLGAELHEFGHPRERARRS